MKKKVISIVAVLVLCLGLFAVSAFAAEGNQDPVSYVAYSWDGTACRPTENIVENYTVVTSNTTTWNSGWYVVEDDVTIDARVEVKGHANLILTDSAKLTIPKGIQLNQSTSRSLTVYGQEGGDGTLTAGVAGKIPSDCAGIGGNYYDGTPGGTITVHGGNVIAKGGSDAAGIGGGSNGGDFTIYHGTVNATAGGGYAGLAAIGTGSAYKSDKTCGSIKIYGGTVTARSSNGPALGGDANNGSILIAGGVVNASTAPKDTAVIGGYSTYRPSVTISGGVVNITKGNARAYLDMEKVSITGGIVYKDDVGTVYGETTLEQALDIPAEKSLIVPENAKLIIPQDVTLTNSGTLQIAGEDSLGGNGTLAGGGNFHLAAAITVPENLTYTGQYLMEAATAGIQISSGSIVVKEKTFSTPTAFTINPAEVKFPGDYTVSCGLQSKTFTVAKATITVEKAEQVGTLTYNGQQQTPTVSVAADTVDEIEATVTYSWRNNSGFSPAVPQLTKKDAGTYTLYYQITAANHETYIGSIGIVVDKFALTDANTSVTFDAMTYNGRQQTPTGNLVVTLEEGKTETITNVVWSAVTNVNESTIATVAESTNFTGITLTKPTGMNALDLSTVTIEKDGALTYNGSEQAQNITVKEPGGNIVTGYTVSGNTATTVKTGGDYTLTVSAGSDSNYTGTKTFEWNIAPAPLTVTAVIPETYWGDEPVIRKVTIPADGLLNDADNVIVSGLTAEPENANDIGDSVTFNVDSSNAVISGNGSGNYDVTVAETATGKVKVIPLTISGITMNANSYVYGGDPVGYNAENLLLSQTVNDRSVGKLAIEGNLTYTYTGTANDNSTWEGVPTKAGSYTLTVSYRDMTHYDVTPQEINFTINKAQVEEPAQDTSTYTYNGDEQTYGVESNAYYTVYGGVQTNANESGYPVTISLEDKDNYKWKNADNSGDLHHTFIINKAPVTLTAKDQSYHIGTSLPETVELNKHYTIEGLVEGDSLGTITVKYQKDGEDATLSVNQTGTYDIVPVITDANANYEITLVNGKLTYYYTPTYTPTVEETTGGSVTVSSNYPSQGQTVTVTPKPDDGYKVSGITITDKDGNAVEVKKNDNGTYSYVQPSGAVTIKVSYEPIKAFADVAKDSYYYDAVYWAVGEGVTNGTGEETFSPNAVCTRAQAVTFLWRAAGCPEPESSVMPFTDVAEGSYYYKAVLWAVENGITNGTSATTFSTNAQCSRAQIVTFLWRSEHGFEMEGEHGFHDVHEDAYYHDAVLWAVENGITMGTSDTTFSPDAECIRAQIVTFLWRCLAE